MNRSVYITRLASFLPNDPVSNDQIETMLGLINGQSSKAKPLILRNNQIKTRYYALDKPGTRNTHQFAAGQEAVLKLLDEEFDLSKVEVLSCGTTTPDQLLPAHAAMVHGELGGTCYGDQFHYWRVQRWYPGAEIRISFCFIRKRK